MNSKVLICEFTGCKLILDNPVTMPCGNSICKHHLEQFEQSNQKCNCFFCGEQHEIPKNGFGVNIALLTIIQNCYELDPIRSMIIKTFNELSQSVGEYVSLDPNVYIYDNFAEIRNKVDLHREESIKEIHERSDEIIRQLKEKEEQCKLNAAKIAKINLNLDNLELWKREIRKVEKNQNELRQLLDELNRNENETKKQLKNLKNGLLLGEIIEFEKIEKKSLFGNLKTRKSYQNLSKECGKLVRIFNNQHTEQIRSIQFDEKSNRLISFSYNRKIKIWDIETGGLLKTLVGHEEWVTSLLILPNNKLISGSEDKTIKIWDLNSYECLNTLIIKSSAFSLCLISDNQIACGDNDGLIKIWNLDNLSKVKKIKAHDDCIRNLLFVYEDKLISCSEDEKIKIWSLKTFKCIKELDGHLDDINYLELTSDGNLLSCSDDKTVKLWELETGKELKSIKFDHHVNSVKELNKDLIAASLCNGNIQIYSLSDSKKIKIIKAHKSNAFLLNQSSNGNLLSGSDGGEIKLWKIFDF